MTSLRELTRRDPTRRRPRVAFVLSGGGNLGAIQVGMLRALTERGIVADVVLGCSVGALNGAGYALDPSHAGVDRLVEHWRHATHTVMPSSRVPSAVQLLRKGASLHSESGLRTSLEALLGADRGFDDLQLPFQCVATDIERAMERWFDDGDLVQAILASAALPAVYPPVMIDGVRYMDGGVVDNVPIGRAVELGCRTIYVLHVGPHGRPDAEIKRPLDGALLAYWVARNSRFARDLASLPDRVEAVVLPPGRRPELKYDDFSQTDELVRQGYDNSSRFLDERAEVAVDRRRRPEMLRPLERLVLSARERSWRQAAEEAAVSPDGAVLTPPTEIGSEVIGAAAPSTDAQADSPSD
jgi:NTE family protein